MKTLLLIITALLISTFTFAGGNGNNADTYNNKLGYKVFSKKEVRMQCKKLSGKAKKSETLRVDYRKLDITPWQMKKRSSNILSRITN